MKKKTKIFLFSVVLLISISLISCAAGGVSVGVYVPGAWVTPPYGGNYPPVGVGIPVY